MLIKVTCTTGNAILCVFGGLGIYDPVELVVQAREALRTILGPDAQFPSSVEADDTKLLRVNEFVEKMSTALKAALPPTRGR